jgi:hypothetical protein
LPNFWFDCSHQISSLSHAIQTSIASHSGPFVVHFRLPQFISFSLPLSSNRIKSSRLKSNQRDSKQGMCLWSSCHIQSKYHVLFPITPLIVMYLVWSKYPHQWRSLIIYSIERTKVIQHTNMKISL